MNIKSYIYEIISVSRFVENKVKKVLLSWKSFICNNFTKKREEIKQPNRCRRNTFKEARKIKEKIHIGMSHIKLSGILRKAI